MLGTNDFQSMHPHNAWHSGEGLRALIRAIRRAPIEPGMPTPAILIVAPPSVQAPKGPIARKFLGAEQKCIGLAERFEQVANEESCHLLDAAGVTRSSVVDGVHLDAGQHAVLGRAIAKVVSTLWISSEV
jgi:lysophospholipase L1-like esterase